MDNKEEETSVNILTVNRLRKLRKGDDETVISGFAYVSRFRVHHEKLDCSTDVLTRISTIIF